MRRIRAQPGRQAATMATMASGVLYRVMSGTIEVVIEAEGAGPTTVRQQAGGGALLNGTIAPALLQRGATAHGTAGSRVTGRAGARTRARRRGTGGGNFPQALVFDLIHENRLWFCCDAGKDLDFQRSSCIFQHTYSRSCLGAHALPAWIKALSPPFLQFCCTGLHRSRLPPWGLPVRLVVVFKNNPTVLLLCMLVRAGVGCLPAVLLSSC